MASSKAAPTGAAAPAVASKVKLSFKEQRELDQLPARIEALEAEQAALALALQSPDLYVGGPQRASELSARHAQIEDELMARLERWELLSARN